MPYVKLDAGILDSTLWVQDAVTCKVFITMLAMANSDGICESTAPGIARRANVHIDEARRAIAILEAPDPDSRSCENEGRRIVRMDGGFQVVNYLKYRNKDHTAVDRKRRERQKCNTEIEQIDSEMSRRDNVTNTSESHHLLSAYASVDQNKVSFDSVDPQAWADMNAYRSLPENRRKWGWSQLAQSKMLAALGKHPPAAQRDMVDKAIRNGWRGIWEDSRKSSAQAQDNPFAGMVNK